MLDEQGRFWNGGVLIEHEPMTLAFASWIQKHPDDDRFILTNGYDWTYFTVKDVPFFVKHVEVGGGSASVRLSDGTEEPLAPSSVEVAEDGVLYTRVKAGKFEARFCPTAQAEMVDLVEEGDDGEPRIRLGAASFPVAPRGGCLSV